MVGRSCEYENYGLEFDYNRKSIDILTAFVFGNVCKFKQLVMEGR